MRFRRREPEAEPVWKQRADKAAETIHRYRPDAPATTGDLLTGLLAALTTAAVDREHLRAAIADIDADQITDELKSALRTRPSPTSPDTPLIHSLRQRHELHHQLLNRADALDTQIEQTVVDLETTAARAIEVSFSAASHPALIDTDLQRLNDDLEALAAARREVDDL